jgi:hypothetical protein
MSARSVSSPPRAPDNGLKGERVVTRIHVPGRHTPFHGACGKRVLRFTPGPMNSRDHLVSWRDHHGQLVRNMWCTAGGPAPRVKFSLTEGQVLRLLSVLGQRRLCTVRSIQSTENAYDKRNPAHRTGRASASCRCRHGRFCDCFPVCDGDGVVRSAGALSRA